MKAPQTEILDTLESEQYSGQVSGTETISVSGVGIIRKVLIKCPKHGPFASGYGRFIQYSMIGGDNDSEWATVCRGGHDAVGVRPDDNKVKIRGDGVSGYVGYEVIFGVECG